METFFGGHIIINIFLVAFLIAVLGYDLAVRKIPNLLTFPVIIVGFISHTVAAGLQGFLFSFYGFAFGIAILFLPFIMGGIGGGDVKLLGAIGALKGIEFVIFAMLYSAIIGALLAVIYMIYKGRFLSTMKKAGRLVFKPFVFILSTRLRLRFIYSSFTTDDSSQVAYEKPLYFPYGVAIVIGTFVALSGFGMGLNIFSL